MLQPATVRKAAQQFFHSNSGIGIKPLGNGLINHTYSLSAEENKTSVVLQAMNTSVFSHPEYITGNYAAIYHFLESGSGKPRIPQPIPAKTGKLLWMDEERNAWRATAYIDHSYSPTSAVHEEAAYTVAHSFAGFTRSLYGIPLEELREIIPGFHNLSYRFRQFEDAIADAPLNRLLKATHCIAELRQRKKLVDFYESLRDNADYPDRVMHHDCKISNILFDEFTNEVICPVDLDTTMAGKFFSDLGDMIRTMACSVDENSIRWEDIAVRPDFYMAILRGYLEGAGDIFTAGEKTNIHYAGLLMTYMQALRFTADFLNGNIYYRTDYPEQNLNRSLNQLILLEKLEEYLQEAFSFTPYH